MLSFAELIEYVTALENNGTDGAIYNCSLIDTWAGSIISQGRLITDILTFTDSSGTAWEVQKGNLNCSMCI